MADKDYPEPFENRCVLCDDPIAWGMDFCLLCEDELYIDPPEMSSLEGLEEDLDDDYLDEDFLVDDPEPQY